MKIAVVINRYNENIDWIQRLDKDISVYVYTKTDYSIDRKNTTIIKLDNYGREALAYIKHITNYYDTLTFYDYLICLQAIPDSYDLNEMIERINRLHKSYEQFNFEYLSNLRIDCDLYGNPQHANIPIKMFIEKLIERNDYENTNKLREFLITNKINCYGNSQFIVNTDCVVKQPLPFYKSIKNLLELSNNDVLFDGYTRACFDDINSFYYCMERLWKPIFNIV